MAERKRQKRFQNCWNVGSWKNGACVISPPAGDGAGVSGAATGLAGARESFCSTLTRPP